MNEQTASAVLASAVNEPGTISRAYSAFHGYSLGNQLLALMQCAARDITPGPIATFVGWKDKGRFVRKGEKALMLCMPVTCKRKGETTDADQPDVFTRFVYRNNWFVLSQTDGADYQPAPIPAWDCASALATLDIMELRYESTDGNCQGYARERTITVSTLAELPHKTRFHELAHVVLGHTSEGAMNDDDRTPRSLREVEAECVALLCCEALGLPGAEFSRGYIQHWNHGTEPIPERSAQRILKAADQILKAGSAVDVA